MYLFWPIIVEHYIKQQVCIPVGCVPPVSVTAIRCIGGGGLGSLSQRPPSPDWALLKETCDSAKNPPEGTWEQATREEVTSYRYALPLGQNDIRFVKTLPCFKLCLQVVTTRMHSTRVPRTHSPAYYVLVASTTRCQSWGRWWGWVGFRSSSVRVWTDF